MLSGLYLAAFNVIRALTPGEFLEVLIEPFYRAIYHFLFHLGL
jgi:hypothetical protein